jgi:hypothetical protein
MDTPTVMYQQADRRPDEPVIVVQVHARRPSVRSKLASQLVYTQP